MVSGSVLFGLVLCVVAAGIFWLMKRSKKNAKLSNGWRGRDPEGTLVRKFVGLRWPLYPPRRNNLWRFIHFRRVDSPRSAISVADLECRRVLRFHFTPIINSGGRNIGVTQPFLNLGDVGFVIQGIGRGGSTQRVGTDLEP
jgi:hypothetical protein